MTNTITYVAGNNSRRIYHTNPDCQYGPSDGTELALEQAHAHDLRECKYCNSSVRPGDNPGTTSDPCPFCGQEDINSFPDHLPDCPEL